MATFESLSVALPVHNAAQSLAQTISLLLDILPDLTRRFEILVVDDGSLDQTVEVAHELARIYPQVRVAEHGERRGRTAVVETALERSAGEILFVQDENAPIDSSKFQRLWELRNHERLVAPAARLRGRALPAKRLAAWGIRLEEADARGEVSGVQMIRRSPRSPLGEHLPRRAVPPRGRYQRVDGSNTAPSRGEATPSSRTDTPTSSKV